jgi:hypothetical protein
LGDLTVHDHPMRTPTVAEPVSDALLGPELGALVESAKNYAAAARSTATRKAYAKQWTAFFWLWCAQQGLCALPAAANKLGAAKAVGEAYVGAGLWATSGILPANMRNTYVSV